MYMYNLNDIIILDLLQMEIEEDYRNLSYKTLTAYQWIWQKYSPKLLPNWIIKTDDDINVDWIEFLARLDSQSQNNVAQNSLICHYVLYNRYPIRNPHDKL